MTELIAAQKAARLREHIAEWRRAQYDAEVNARVGKAIGDEKIVAEATAQLARVLRALDTLTAMLVELGE